MAAHAPLPATLRMLPVEAHVLIDGAYVASGVTVTEVALPVMSLAAR